VRVYMQSLNENTCESTVMWQTFCSWQKCECLSSVCVCVKMTNETWMRDRRLLVASNYSPTTVCELLQLPEASVTSGKDPTEVTCARSQSISVCITSTRKFQQVPAAMPDVEAKCADTTKSCVCCPLQRRDVEQMRVSSSVEEEYQSLQLTVAVEECGDHSRSHYQKRRTHSRMYR
jgi:hypothetical protein